MGGDRDGSGQNSLMMHAAQLSNAQPVWMLLWPKDLFFWNESNPAKKCWFVLWLCSPNWSCACAISRGGFGLDIPPSEFEREFGSDTLRCLSVGLQVDPLICRGSKYMKTISESGATGPERSWLRHALLSIWAAALLGLAACANQSGANDTMPWYERTPVSASPPR